MSRGVIKETRYLVIGGSGFLGSYITQALIDRGEKFVAVYDLAKPPKPDVIRGVDYFCGDILNESLLLECLKKTAATTVFHTVSPHHGLQDNIYTRVNVEGTRTILRACHTAAVKHLVYTSSASVVWSDGDISGISEDEIQMPQKVYEWYAHTKGIAENMVMKESGVNGMKVVALRPCGMIGTKPAITGEVFFISDGKPVPYWTLPHLVFKQLGFDGQASYGRGGCPGAALASQDSLSTSRPKNNTTILTRQNLLGYKPRVPLEEGITRMVEWWKERGEREHLERANGVTAGKVAST